MLKIACKIAGLLLTCILLQWPLTAQEKSRGNFLRTEIRKTEKSEQYVCTLKPGADSFPCLQFKRQYYYTYHEVRIYEMLEQINAEGDDNTPKTTGSYQFRLLPGEFWEGEKNIRNEIKEDGFFANDTFLINGKALQTDEQGIIVANAKSGLDILDFFDNLNKRQLDLDIEHALLGNRKLSIYRTMPRRPKTDEKNLDEESLNDLLVAFNLDFYQRTSEPERQKLKVEYFLNTLEIQPGMLFTIIVKITNAGMRETSCLLGRTFSRESWLNGKLFYFGAIAPGNTQIFSRTFQPDQILKVEHCFAALALSDSWGELPQHQLNLKIPVKK
ncbi:MAG: hypothetical protein WCT05_11900 [Lentisphaeria bacterium]